MKEMSFQEVIDTSKELANERAKSKTNPYIIPLYVVVDIDEETGLINSVTQPEVRFMFGKKIVTE